jgi:hypothetical protein
LQLELGGRQISQRAVWPGLVVFDPPCLDNLSDMSEVHKPVLVQAFISIRNMPLCMEYLSQGPQTL